MAREKLKRFKDNQVNPIVIEDGKPFYESAQGKWHTLFNNNNDLTLELACGRGEYTIGLAEKFPNRNFLGIDIKGERIWKGAYIAQEKQLNNVAFLRTFIQNIDQFFEENEVQEIWIIHPDPRPKKRDLKRRLTHPRFLKMYQKISDKNAFIHVKTDNRDFFDYSLEEIEKFGSKDLAFTYDLYTSDLMEDHHGITTRFEKKFVELGSKINYLKFRFK